MYKLKPSLGDFKAIWPGNSHGLILMTGLSSGV